MNVAGEEQETIINLSRNGNRATIWTSETTMMTKLDRMTEKNPKEWKMKNEDHFTDGTTADKIYTCPKAFISFRSMERVNHLTDEQRKAAGERMRERRAQNLI